MTRVEEFAPAKINLTLHVAGQRDDGYHLLDSLVCFADIGDRISAAPDAELSLEIAGPEAAALAVEADNLVLRAARLIAPDRGAALRLVKCLPVASGIGGGSADAAATLRGLSRLFGAALPGQGALVALGADVPACLLSAPLRMRGIGDTITPLSPLPEAEILLVNPRVPVPTPAVFAALERKANPPMPDALPRWHDLGDLADWLAHQRNDLFPPALSLQPVIGEVMEALRASGARFTTMSGSGATCVALFERGAAAAADRLRNARPGWWVASGRMTSGD
jgi:4-diphosphocytidyl-2-C-methyl-D-erythritol kinase